MRQAVAGFVFFQVSLMNAAGAENLAIHKRYTLEPRPNYRLCTDPGDAIELTDGKAWDSHWTRKSTVGWHWPAEVPQITIDLGKVSWVEKVAIHTAAGTRGSVKLWRYAVVLLSDDGVDYGLAGFAEVPEAIREAALRERVVQPVVTVPGINANGRFVKVIVQQETPSFFTDEIEVFGSGERRPSARILAERIGSDYAFQAIKAVEERLGRKAAQKIEASGKPEDRTQAEPLSIRSADPMNQRVEMDDGTGADRAEVSLWQGEVGSLAFNIRNSTSQAMTLRVAVPGLKPDGSPVQAGVFETRLATEVFAVGAGRISDALVLLGGPLTAEPGRVYQVWLTINTAGLAAGEYSASLKVSSLDKPSVERSLPLRMIIQPIRMGEEPALHSYNWAYPNLSDITRGHRSDAAKDLQAHGITVFMVHTRNLPLPTGPASAVRPVPPRSYLALDTLLQENNYARVYLLLLGFSEKNKDRGAFGRWMTTTWKANFKRWLAGMVEHLRARGIGYDRFALYPYDEYIGDDFYDVARVVREADPRVRIFANSYGKGPEAFDRLLEGDLVDIWCVSQKVSEEHPDWLRRVKSFGKEYWCYRALNRAADPLENYRKLCWWAFKNGLTGAGFWVYADAGRPTWDDYGKPMGNYGVVYGAYGAPVETRGEPIVPSRRWEAWRQGVQDYQYLTELQGRIDRVRPVHPAKADSAQQQLNQWVSEVLTGELARCIDARRQISSKIVELDVLLK